jgi:ubiquinone/menaquinone biosynthesis C-methylase UbiE
MPSQRLETLKQDYDRRAASYDEGVFHQKQAVDYIKWMSLKPGYNVLDLACGTGNVTIPAAEIVELSGTVIGVDISPASLEIARAKAQKAGVIVKFLEHDISDLHALESEGIKEDTFDIISCASAFIVVEDPGAAIKGWAKLLKKGGKIICDVPSGDSTIQWTILARVAETLGKSVTYPRAHLDSMEKLKKHLSEAGLDAEESFATEDYEGVDRNRTFVPAEAAQFFDELFGELMFYRQEFALFSCRLDSSWSSCLALQVRRRAKNM